ncbi:MAG: hypothetical protein Q7W45_15685 [Bacteroidota bacterium]|nr:hypothetical protein [Bacteroidota bacterium]MDP3145544.1 hypothetical protein [Bacteroidota bacterium]
MNSNAEFCNVKSKIPQNTKTILKIFVLILGVLVSSILMLLNYFSILNINLEVVFAPLVVIAFLTYGGKLFIYLLVSPITKLITIKP